MQYCGLCREEQGLGEEQTEIARISLFNPGDLLCCSTEGSLKVTEARSEVHHKFKPSSNTQPTCASPAEWLIKSGSVQTLVS